VNYHKTKLAKTVTKRPAKATRRLLYLLAFVSRMINQPCWIKMFEQPAVTD
jgi:hypothetical protein